MAANPNPRVSVVIPMYNAQKTIEKSLAALEKQTFRDFEVVIVDDGSTDKSPDIVKSYKMRMHLKLLKQKNSGPAKARNLGAKEASGNIVVFTDSDCVPREDWLSEMIAPFEDASVAGVQGTYETLNRDKLVARYVGYEIAYRHEQMNMRKDIDFIGTVSAAYRKNLFWEAGGFDVSFLTSSGEDPDLSYRMKAKGYRMVCNPRAVVAHPHPETLYKFLRQQFWRGYWRVPMFGKHKKKIIADSYSGNELFFQAIFSVLFMASLLSLNAVIVAITGAALLISNLPIALYSAKKGKKFFLIAPIIASMRSIAGSLGFIYGFFRFNLKL